MPAPHVGAQFAPVSGRAESPACMAGPSLALCLGGEGGAPLDAENGAQTS